MGKLPPVYMAGSLPDGLAGLMHFSLALGLQEQKYHPLGFGWQSLRTCAPQFQRLV